MLRIKKKGLFVVILLSFVVCSVYLNSNITREDYEK